MTDQLRDRLAGIGPQDSRELRAYKQCLHELGWCPGIYWSEDEGLMGHDLPTYLEYMSLKHEVAGLRKERCAEIAHRILSALMEGTMPAPPMPGNAEAENMAPALEWLTNQIDAAMRAEEGKEE